MLVKTYLCTSWYAEVWNNSTSTVNGAEYIRMGIQYSLVNIVWGAVFTSEYCMGAVFTSEYCMGCSIHWWLWGYSIPWGGGGVRYSLVNNVRGVRYSLGYRIHSDTRPHTEQSHRSCLDIRQLINTVEYLSMLQYSKDCLPSLNIIHTYVFHPLLGFETRVLTLCLAAGGIKG